MNKTETLIFKRRPNPARLETPVFKAIAYGLNAPNPHNSQTWKFKVVSKTEAFLFLDPDRLLPATDPLARQIYLGCGTLLETMAIGASAEGYEVDLHYFPEGLPQIPLGEKDFTRPVARIALRQNPRAVKDKLFEALYLRQTNRKPYHGPIVTEAEFQQMANLAKSSRVEMIFKNQPEEMRPFFEIFYQAMKVETVTQRCHEEAFAWFRLSEKARKMARSGLSLPQMGMEGWLRVITEVLLQVNPNLWFNSGFNQAYFKQFKQGIESSRGFVFLKTVTNEPTDWLEAGRVFARFALAAAGMGLYLHPYTQVLQEYPEMAELQARFHQLQNIKPPAKIQMAFRLGRGNPPYLSYRRLLKEFIIQKP
ncbi:MAG TPA: hypothetical protein VHY08_00365 [Bacillota bacterium]|nr:hypothetical protein [Bacillota bacterium]